MHIPLRLICILTRSGRSHILTARELAASQVDEFPNVKVAGERWREGKAEEEEQMQ